MKCEKCGLEYSIFGSENVFIQTKEGILCRKCYERLRK